MMDQFDRAAEEIERQHGKRERYQILDEAIRPQTLEDAYQAQLRLETLWSEGRRGSVGGYKIALTSKPIQELCGVDHPVGGVIFENEIHQSPARMKAADFVRVGLEFEVCMKVAVDLTETGDFYNEENVRELVAEIAPAFEFIEDRNADYSTLTGHDLVTDGGWCGGIALGASVKDFRQLDLVNARSVLHYNDEVEETVTGAALGNPFAGLAWVANWRASLGSPVKAGHWVMTGSALKTRFPIAGDHAKYDIDGLGSVEVVFE